MDSERKGLQSSRFAASAGRGTHRWSKHGESNKGPRAGAGRAGYGRWREVGWSGR